MLVIPQATEINIIILETQKEMWIWWLMMKCIGNWNWKLQFMVLYYFHFYSFGCKICCTVPWILREKCSFGKTYPYTQLAILPFRIKRTDTKLCVLSRSCVRSILDLLWQACQHDPVLPSRVSLSVQGIAQQTLPQALKTILKSWNKMTSICPGGKSP